jgi:DNA-binding transcriptional ArsR family regulator
MPHEYTESQLFALLAKRRRRLVIRVLAEIGTPISVTDLARRIGEREKDSLSNECLRSIRTSLHHIHLPKLDDAGVVRYDRTEEMVYAEPDLHSLIRFLEKVAEGDRPWSDS